MTPGLISDVFYQIGNGAWDIATAIVVIASSQIILKLISHVYDSKEKTDELLTEDITVNSNDNDKVKKEKENKKKEQTKKIEQKLRVENKLQISLASFNLMASIVVLIYAARIVLREEWVEQMTSGLVVGLGFGLQFIIKDVVMGFVRRSYGDIMKGCIIQVKCRTTRKYVTGVISRMHITSFEMYVDESLTKKEDQTKTQGGEDESKPDGKEVQQKPDDERYTRYILPWGNLEEFQIIKNDKVRHTVLGNINRNVLQNLSTGVHSQLRLIFPTGVTKPVFGETGFLKHQ